MYKSDNNSWGLIAKIFHWGLAVFFNYANVIWYKSTFYGIFSI